MFRLASPRATSHLYRRHAKSPCQLDMTHAMPHTHHCDNPVIINTNLSASARGAKVLWSWRERGGGKRKGRHTKYWSWNCHLWLWDQAASVNVTVHTGQSDKRRANSCSSFCLDCCGFYVTQEEVGRSRTHTYRGKKRRRIIPTKTSALMGPTTVITRHRFQIRHLSSQLRVPRKQKAL